MSKKKKNRANANAVKTNTAEERLAAKKNIEINDLSGWHKLLFWFKVILATSYLFNIYAIIQDGLNGTDMIDLIVNAGLLILLVLSVFMHEKKKGVYFFFAFGAVELLYNIVIMILAARNGVFEGAIGNRAFEYIIFSAVILIPTAVYYKKRMSLLRS